MENPQKDGERPLDFSQETSPDESQIRPLSMAWISDELLAETQDVWTEISGQPVSEEEAIEILMNVKHYAEVLLRVGREVSNK